MSSNSTSELHEHFPLVPEPIREYIDEVKVQLVHLTQHEVSDVSLLDKLNFLRETRMPLDGQRWS